MYEKAAQEFDSNFRTYLERHILKHGVESTFGVEPWSGVDFWSGFLEWRFGVT